MDYKCDPVALDRLRQRNKNEVDLKMNITNILHKILGDEVIAAKIKQEEDKKEAAIQSGQEVFLNMFYDTFVDEVDIARTKKILLDTYLNGDERYLKLYLCFLYMFPGVTNNEKWDRHFGVIYDNVTLRRKSMGSIKKLIKIFETKKYDNLTYLTGVYLFIEEGISLQRKKAYVRKMETFFREDKDWYGAAEEYLQENTIGDLLDPTRRTKQTVSSFQL